METYYRRSRTTLEAEVRRRAGGQLIGGWQTNDHSFLPREGGGAGMEKGKFNPKKVVVSYQPLKILNFLFLP
jgi:hypothetical protein